MVFSRLMDSPAHTDEDYCPDADLAEDLACDDLAYELHHDK